MNSEPGSPTKPGSPTTKWTERYPNASPLRVQVLVGAGGSGVWSEADAQPSTPGSASSTQALLPQFPEPKPRWRRRALQMCAALMGMAAVVLLVVIPATLLVGRMPYDNTPEQIPRPPPALRLIVAAADPAAPIERLLPSDLVAGVRATERVPGTGMQVVTLASNDTLRRVATALRNSTAVLYFFRDFPLSVDRRFGRVTGPMEVADQVWAGHDSKWEEHLRRRTLLQGGSRGGGSNSSRGTSFWQPAAQPEARFDPMEAKLQQLRAGLLQARMQRRRQQHIRLQLGGAATARGTSWGGKKGKLLPTPGASAGAQAAGKRLPSTLEGLLDGAGMRPTNASAAALQRQRAAAAAAALVAAIKGAPAPGVQPLSGPAAAGAGSGLGSFPDLSSLFSGIFGGRRRQLQGTSDNSSAPLDNTDRGYQAGYAAPLPQSPLQPYLKAEGLNVQAAWAAAKAVPGAVVLAVVDTGLEVTHPALGANTWSNPGEEPSNDLDDDANGFADDSYGWNFGGHCADAACSYCAPDADASDDSQGGSYAAGVAAGAFRGEMGTSGVANQASIMALRVADCQTGRMWASHALQAYAYAAANGAHVVLSSFLAEAEAGCDGDEAWPSCRQARAAAFADALAPLADAGTLVVAPATAAAQQLPCSLASQAPNLVCASDGAAAGADVVVDAAGLYAPFPGAGFAPGSGASVAAAVVAGAAALVQGAIAAQHGGSAEGLGAMAKQALLASYSAAGQKLDAARAVQQALQAELELLPSGPTATATGLVTAPGLQRVWRYSGDQSDTANMPLVHQSTLLTAFPAAGWEYTGAAAVAVISGHLSAQLPGSYRLRAVTPDPFVLTLEGQWQLMQRAGAADDTWEVAVTLLRPGNYSLGLFVFGPTAPFDLQWQLPGGSIFTPIAGRLWSFGEPETAANQLLQRGVLGAQGEAAGKAAAHPPGRLGRRQLVRHAVRHSGSGQGPQRTRRLADASVAAGSVGWLALAAPYNVSKDRPAMTPAPAAQRAPWSSALGPALAFSQPGDLAAAIFGARASAMRAAYGQLSSWLDGAALGGGSVPAAARADGAAWLRFRLVCDGCGLLLDGLPVAGALYDIPSVSPCVALPLAGSAGGGVGVAVAFRTADVQSAGLTLEYDACSRPAGAGALAWQGNSAWQPVTALLGAHGLVLGAAAAADGAAYVPGMLCAMRNVSVAGLDASAAAAAFIPPPAAAAAGMQLSVAQLAPGMGSGLAGAPSLTVSCWAYWSGTLGSNASVGVSPPGVGRGQLYVGTHEALSSVIGVPGDPPTHYAAGGGVRLLVLEWTGVGPGSQVWVATDDVAAGGGARTLWDMSGVLVPAARAAGVRSVVAS